MEHEAHFSWFKFIPALAQLPYHVVAAGAVALFLMTFAVIGRLALASAKDTTIPPSKLTLLGICDMIADAIHGFAESMLGKDAPLFTPLVGTLFLYILTCNLMGMIPGFAPPTDNVNTTLACGIFVFFYYNYQGLKSGGIRYLQHFLGPVWYLAWMLLPIEILSHMVRPFTLAMRLRGNMVGDHTVISVFTHMAPYLAPVPFYFLGLLVCFIQAFVFVTLSMVYISMARDAAHH